MAPEAEELHGQVRHHRAGKASRFLTLASVALLKLGSSTDQVPKATAVAMAKTRRPPPMSSLCGGRGSRAGGRGGFREADGAGASISRDKGSIATVGATG
jgi:hypothetical protein